MTTVSLNAVGGFTAPSGSPITSLSGNQTTASGDSVLCAVAYVPSTGSPTISVTCGGAAMTLVGTEDESTATTEVVLKYFKIDGVASGSPSVVVTASAATYMAAQSISLSGGVGSWGTAQATGGSGSSMSQSTTGYATGDLVIQSFAARGWNGTSGSNGFGTLTGGTNQAHLGFTPSGSFKGPDLTISTATADTTFTALNAPGGVSTFWAGLALVVAPATGLTPASATVTISRSTPSIGITVNPSGPTVVVTTGTPGLTISNPTTYFPTSATITVTPGTPVVSSPKVLSPASASVGITGGTPGIAQAYGPLARVVNNLTLRQSTTIVVSGDSTAWGTADAEQTTLFGWGGRLALALGKYYGANVQAFATQYPSSGNFGSAVSVYSGAGLGAPMITVYIAAWPGGTWSANLLPSEGGWLTTTGVPDAVLIGEGFNEGSTSAYTSGYLAFINNNSGNDLQTRYPGVPITVTTQNRATITQESGHVVAFSSLFSAMLTTFLGSSTLPLSPALQYSTTTAGVWVLDTQQAYDPAILSSLINPADGLHPIDVGYQKQALWMLSQLAPAAATTLSPATATVTVSASTPTVFNGITTVVTPTGASMSVTAGTPSTSLTGHVLTQPTGSLVTVTAGLAVVLGAGLHVSPAVARVTVLGGIPVVAIAFPAISTPPSRTLVAPTRYRTRGVLR